MALAIAILCFCPPDSFTPRSPISVKYPLDNFSINTCAFACFAASITSSVVAVLFPYLIFSSIVPENRNTS